MGLVKTGNRGEAALGEAENFSNRIFFGTAGKTIAALHSAIGLQELGPIEQRNDLFQILLRNSLPFGNIFERNMALISIGLTLGQVEQHPQRVAALRGNFHTAIFLRLKFCPQLILFRNLHITGGAAGNFAVIALGPA